MNFSQPAQDSLFFKKEIYVRLAVLLALIAGVGIRLFDLSDPPLDFHPTRQFFSALKARGMYYAMQPNAPQWMRDVSYTQWQAQGKIEPTVLESLTAVTYLLVGREDMNIARAYSALFWVLGGLALFSLARRLTGADAALLALLFYLFTRYAVFSSRTFQPDPLMVALMVGAVWAFERWRANAAWKWALAAGLLAGAAIYVKNVAVFMLAPAFALPILFEMGLKPALKNRQVWGVAALAILPAAAYTLYGVMTGFLGGQFTYRFFPDLTFSPGYYVRWNDMLSGVVGFGAFLLALTGVLLAQQRGARALIGGLFLGYFLFGVVFAYHFSTHDYYHMPLIPIVALGLAAAAQRLFDALRASQPAAWIRLGAVAIILYALGMEVWNTRVTLVRNDYRAEPAFWVNLGERLGHTEPATGLMSDYGYRLAYWGWQDTSAWLGSGDLHMRELAGQQVDLLAAFRGAVDGKRFFVVTQMNELDNQPEIKALLYNTYSIFEQGEGYVVFDLQKPLTP